jgi:hypothetical protein
VTPATGRRTVLTALLLVAALVGVGPIIWDSGNGDVTNADEPNPVSAGTVDELQWQSRDDS